MPLCLFPRRDIESYVMLSVLGALVFVGHVLFHYSLREPLVEEQCRFLGRQSLRWVLVLAQAGVQRDRSLWRWRCCSANLGVLRASSPNPGSGCGDDVQTRCLCRHLFQAGRSGSSAACLRQARFAVGDLAVMDVRHRRGEVLCSDLCPRCLSAWW